MQALWAAMDSTLKAGVLQGAATILAAAFGFGGVIIMIILQGRMTARRRSARHRPGSRFSRTG